MHSSRVSTSVIATTADTSASEGAFHAYCDKVERVVTDAISIFATDSVTISHTCCSLNEKEPMNYYINKEIGMIKVTRFKISLSNRYVTLTHHASGAVRTLQYAERRIDGICLREKSVILHRGAGYDLLSRVCRIAMFDRGTFAEGWDVTAGEHFYHAQQLDLPE